MPVIFQKGHIKFSIHKKDHNPPHVHINAAGSELIVNLHSLEIQAAKGFTLSQIKQLLKAVEQYHELLIAEWEAYHG